MAENLKPCPFCGEVSVTEEHVTFENPSQNRCAIVCENCGAYGGPALGFNQRIVAEKATELWNTRAGRNETIEECAKTCEQMVKEIVCPEECAAAIRDLKEA